MALGGAVLVAAVRVSSSRPLAKLLVDEGGCLLQCPCGGDSTPHYPTWNPRLGVLSLPSPACACSPITLNLKNK